MAVTCFSGAWCVQGSPSARALKALITARVSRSDKAWRKPHISSGRLRCRQRAPDPTRPSRSWGRAPSLSAAPPAGDRWKPPLERQTASVKRRCCKMATGSPFPHVREFREFLIPVADTIFESYPCGEFPGITVSKVRLTLSKRFLIVSKVHQLESKCAA